MPSQGESGFVLDVAGVGIGPFNLSLAALLVPVSGLTSHFYERKPELQWHPGLLFDEATIQVSFLKDLVSLADPTSPYSFLAFLAQKKRLYRFINAAFPRVLRREFNEYLQWVCGRLNNLRFDSEVQEIDCDDRNLRLRVGDQVVPTRNVVLGTGHQAKIPDCARPFLGESVFHAGAFLNRPRDFTGRTLAVVGGGQTGAETVWHVVNERGSLPDRLLWFTRRTGFAPLDESPFTNEIFTPRYSDYFYRLKEAVRLQLLDAQKLASDGISTVLLEALYRRFYELEYLDGRREFCSLHPSRELVGMEREGDRYRLQFRDGLDGGVSSWVVDGVILATGYHYRPPSCLEPLLPRTSWNGCEYELQDDFSIAWDGPPGLRIYVQNASRQLRGVADPNLSLMAWRSATIVNSLAGTTVYDVEEEPFLLCGQPGDAGAVRREEGVG